MANTETKTSKNMLIRWLVICLIPAATIAVSILTQPHDQANYLIFGIAIACEIVFLFKFVLFEVIKHRLKNENVLAKQTAVLFLPLLAFIIYLFHYFGAF
ncbi:hypothetical protein [Neisseria montereyensis]|uniref:Uncharacterized protein n=1 Tax=Neisseria montereyensis TaxID=2973938 RepID=A0ABT2FCU3_9NEIS|nr:hypothetical protein [Neisseria montereyensis]MCS4533761.1 hypothetical protein [Neisseria montereyensis]